MLIVLTLLLIFAIMAVIIAGLIWYRINNDRDDRLSNWESMFHEQIENRIQRR